MTSQRALIVSGLRTLGASKAARMLSAFDLNEHKGTGGWSCPLARAYGKPGELVEEHGVFLTVLSGDEEIEVKDVTPEIVAPLLGLTVEEVRAIARSYDEAEGNTVSRFELHTLVAAVSLEPIAYVGSA
jgi:hypothetical protein